MTKSFVEITSKKYQNYKDISKIFSELRQNKFLPAALNVFKSDCQELISEFEVERDNFMKNKTNGYLKRGPNPVTNLSQVVEQISNIENEYSKVTDARKDDVNQSCFDILRSIHAKLKHLPNLTKTENEVLRKTQTLGTYLYIKHCPTAQKRIKKHYSRSFLNQLNKKLEQALCHIAGLKRNQKSFLKKYLGIIKSCNLKTQRMI